MLLVHKVKMAGIPEAREGYNGVSTSSAFFPGPVTCEFFFGMSWFMSGVVKENPSRFFFFK